MPFRILFGFIFHSIDICITFIFWYHHRLSRLFCSQYLCFLYNCCIYFFVPLCGLLWLWKKTVVLTTCVTLCTYTPLTLKRTFFVQSFSSPTVFLILFALIHFFFFLLDLSLYLLPRFCLFSLYFIFCSLIGRYSFTPPIPVTPDYYLFCYIRRRLTFLLFSHDIEYVKRESVVLFFMPSFY